MRQIEDMRPMKLDESISYEEVCRTLKELKIGVGKRLLSGDIVLYREPKPRYKKEFRTVITPWLNMTQRQAQCLAASILDAISMSNGQGSAIIVGQPR